MKEVGVSRAKVASYIIFESRGLMLIAEEGERERLIKEGEGSND